MTIDEGRAMELPGNPMEQLAQPPMIDELTNTQPAMPGAPQASMRDQLKSFNSGPVEDFLIELLGVADDLGVLDKSFGPPSVEDQLDVMDQNSDPMEFLNRQQLESLISKFMAIPEPQRSQIADKLKQELPPQVVKRLSSIMRLTSGRDVQQQIAPTQTASVQATPAESGY